MGVIRNAARRDKKELDGIIKELENLFKQKIAKDDVVKTLNRLLPTFQHIETGLNLDQKM